METDVDRPTSDQRKSDEAEAWAKITEAYPAVWVQALAAANELFRVVSARSTMSHDPPSDDTLSVRRPGEYVGVL